MIALANLTPDQVADLADQAALADAEFVSRQRPIRYPVNSEQVEPEIQYELAHLREVGSSEDVQAAFQAGYRCALRDRRQISPEQDLELGRRLGY